MSDPIEALGERIGWQEDGSYVPCPACKWVPPPPNPTDRTPGVPMGDPFRVVGCATHHGDCPKVSLPPDVQRKLQADLEDMVRCQRRAWASASTYVIG